MEAVFAATLFQAAGSVIDGAMTKGMYDQQAKILSKQMVAEQTNNSREIAVEKAAAANESLERTKKLQRIIASTTAAGAYAGLSTDMGLIRNVNENSSYEASIEESIARSNSAQRQTSLNLNSATNQLNLSSQISQAKSSGKTAMLKGFMGAASSVGSFYQWKKGLGEV